MRERTLQRMNKDKRMLVDIMILQMEKMPMEKILFLSTFVNEYAKEGARDGESEKA